MRLFSIALLGRCVSRYHVDMQRILIAIASCFLSVLPAENPNPSGYVAIDYSSLIAELSPSVVTVEADAGNGSGFVVHEIGLIATNYHVVANTRFLAVGFSDGRRVNAEVVKLDSRSDLALLKVHADHVRGRIPVLRVTRFDSDVRPGTPVLALGAPLGRTSFPSQGIVSKVSETSLLGDYLLEPGSSGGPLVLLSGDVVGINTFGVGDIAGAIRIHLLREIIAGLDIERVEKILVPLEELAPAAVEEYPLDLLRIKANQQIIPSSYVYMAGAAFAVRISTPVSQASSVLYEDLQQAANRYKRRGRKIHDPTYSAVDEVFYRWHQDAVDLTNLLVTVTVDPQATQTTGSLVGQMVGAGLGLGAHLIPSTFKFKKEFYRVHIERDGELIEPFRRGRFLDESFVRNPIIRFVDEAYGGKYQYDPRDFLFGNVFVFKVYEATNQYKPHHSKTFKADSDLIKAIRSDFRETVGEAGDYWRSEYRRETVPPGTGEVTVGDGSIGVRHAIRDQYLELTEVLPGSTAYAGGLRTGDLIMEIDGTSTVGWLRQRLGESHDFSKLLNLFVRGKLSDLKLTVLHGKLDPYEIRFKR